jgi:hypothetical protein
MTTCIHCNKQYSNAKCFKKHFSICDVLNGGANDDELLNLKELTILVKKLVKDNHNKTKRIKILENKLLKPKEVNLIKYLNENIKNITSFNDFINSIKIDDNNINLLLNNGFVEGIINLIRSKIPNEFNEDIPIRSFYESPYNEKLLIYDGNKWIELNQTQFDDVIFNIQRALINYRETWQMKLGEKIYNSESDKYLQLSAIILGGDNRENNILKCYKKLYHSIKIRARNFINNRYKII